jgi:hypothetical protein
MQDEPFKLLFQTTHERFQQDKEWCLTAKRDGIGSLIHVRECKQFDEDEVNLQLWEKYDNDQLKLSDSSRNLCLRARHRRIYLHTCQEKADYRNSFIVDESSNYIEHENDDGLQFLLGLRRSNVMGRVLLMQANTRSVVDNDTLTWNVRYMSQTSAPTVSRSEPPSMLESATPSTPPSAWEIATSSPITSPTKSPTSSPSNYPSFSPSIKSSPSSSPTVQGGGGGGRTIPVPSPVESPTTCIDDPDFTFELINTVTNSVRTRNCAWLTTQPQRAQYRIDRFCTSDVPDNCKLSCGNC